MAEVVNLRMARKRKERAEAEAKAASNRALHGQTKAEKNRQRAEQARLDRTVEGARREAEPPKSQD